MSDTSLTGTIQEIVQDCIKGMKLADMVTGTVLSVSPLSIQPDISMPPLPEAALIETSAVKARTEAAQGGEGGSVVVNPGISAGDKVLMLRVANGQSYILLSVL